MIKNYKNSISMAFVFLLMSVFINSCIKPDSSPRLEILVLDESGDPVTNAFVSLYETIEEWGMKETPVQAWKKTDKYGKVVFVTLNEIVYYIYVVKENKDNSDGFVKTEEILKLNEIVKVKIYIK